MFLEKLGVLAGFRHKWPILKTAVADFDFFADRQGSQCRLMIPAFLAVSGLILVHEGTEAAGPGRFSLSARGF